MKKSPLGNIKGVTLVKSAIPKPVKEDIVKPVKEDIPKSAPTVEDPIIKKVVEDLTLSQVSTQASEHIPIDVLMKELEVSSQVVVQASAHEPAKQSKIKIEMPEEVNASPIILEMFKKLGDKTCITGYDKPPCYTFTDMKLDLNILKGIISIAKWDTPSLIQALACGPVINGRDLLAQAQAGTGKSGAFSIAVLQKINPKIRGLQTIILSSSRELAQQTFSVILDLATFTPVTIACHIGGAHNFDERGVSYAHNVVKNAQGQCDTAHYAEQVVVATPGRLLMLIKKGLIKVNGVNLVVLDEADCLLGQGFVDDISKIFHTVPDKIQVALYSATLSEEIIALSKEFMRTPVCILVPQTEHVVTDNQTQYNVQVENDEDKKNVLTDILSTNATSTPAIIFCNTIKDVNDVFSHVKTLGLSVGRITSEMEQSEREESMERFRSGVYKILVASDVVTRGIDTYVVTVINYSIPRIQTQYIHRIGRTGRFGKHGHVVNIVNQNDLRSIQNIKIRYRIEFMPFSKFMERSPLNP